jgi:uncharacterized protein (TIGR02147 family)
MKNVFDFKDYKEFLRKVVGAKESPRGTQSQLARHLGCQSAYLYQVLKGSGNLTEDQAYKVTTFLEFTPAERDYFLLLVRVAKAGSAELRGFLSTEIQKRRDEELDLRNKTEAQTPPDNEAAWSYYFSSSLPSLIHIATSSPKFQTVEAIARKLKVEAKIVRAHLGRLLSFGFVNLHEKKWIYGSPSFHFAKDSRHNLALQLMHRSQAVSSLLNDPGSNHGSSQGSSHGSNHVAFSTLFTLDKKGYEDLRGMVSRFVENTHKTVHGGGTDEIYILSLDLFAPYPERA